MATGISDSSRDERRSIARELTPVIDTWAGVMRSTTGTPLISSLFVSVRLSEMSRDELTQVTIMSHDASGNRIRSESSPSIGERCQLAGDLNDSMRRILGLSLTRESSMGQLPVKPWLPLRLERVEESYHTSMGTTRIKTDATRGYIKTMGNRQGPHALACEFVATQLARWFGLSIAEFAILDLPAEACFEFPQGARVQPGPAFISRHVDGATWGGTKDELESLENPDDITRLVVFDTWVRNCDRHPADLTSRKPNYANVYLANTNRPTRTRLLAIDQTHCFDCGHDLTPRLSEIAKTKDQQTYGLFPAFAAFIKPFQLTWCAEMLRNLKADDVGTIVESIPVAWDVPQPARIALHDLICQRAVFLADRINDGWRPGNPS